MKLSYLEYADDFVSVNEDPDKSQVFLDHLNHNAAVFGMRSVPPKCKMLSYDWIGSKPNPILGEEEMVSHVRFNCSDCCASTGGRMSDEVHSSMQWTRLAFTSLLSL